MSKKTLYVSRRLLNTAPFLLWAKQQGFTRATPPEHLHVTIIYSNVAVGWSAIERIDCNVYVPPRNILGVEPLGDAGAIVLRFNSAFMQYRWREFIDAGCENQYGAFKPHVTITYDGSGVDLRNVAPFDGELQFGPEIFRTVNDDWADDLKEVALSRTRSYTNVMQQLHAVL